MNTGAGPGAPPAFDSRRRANPTLVGIPGEDESASMPPPVPSGRRIAPRKPVAGAPPVPSGPPPAGPPGLDSGPPDIGLSESGDPFGPAEGLFSPPPSPGLSTPGVTEFDASSFGGGDALELDLPTAGAPNAPFQPPPSGELDLPVPSGPGGGASSLDLPAPAAAPRSSGPSLPPPPPQAGLDLPAPAPGGAGRRAGGLDLPAPAPPRPPAPGGLDLPAPAIGSGGLDLPAPQHNLPAPRPAGGPALPDIDLDLPQPSAGGGAQLPAPVGVDLPAPAGLDLPGPAGMNLQPAGMNVQPANMNVQPANMNLQPAGGLDVQPAETGLVPNDLGMLEPVRPGQSAPGTPLPSLNGAQAADHAMVSHRRSPSPRKVEARGSSKGLIYGAAGLALVAAIGVGVWASGILEGTDDPATAGQQRGAPGTTEKSAPQPSGPVQDRSGEVLAKFKVDSPEAYQEAMKLAQESGDAVGAAEAGLLLHLRYGPDPVLLEQSNTVLAGFASETAPFVARVRGLSALAKQEYGAADQALAGDDPRTVLYRGQLRLAQKKYDEAKTLADSVLATDQDDLTALHLKHAASMGLDPHGSRDGIAKAVSDHPAHPGLRELLVEVGIETGYLRQADEAANELTAPEDAPQGYRARLLTLRGRLATARGDLNTGIKQLNEALALAPKNEPTQLALGQAQLLSGNLIEASATVDGARRDHPKSVELALLKVDVLIESGDGDKALEVSSSLEKQLPNRPEVPYLQGKVQAMRMQVEEGTALFAKALQKDPNFYPAMLAEAEMLETARQPALALDKIDAALRWTEGASASPAIKAEILLTKARMLIAQQQTRAGLTALDEALAAEPSNNEAQTLRGVMRLQQGMYEQGRADLMGVFERTGGYPSMTAPLGRLLAREKDVERLAELVGDAADGPRASTDLQLIGARLRLLQGNAEGAKALAEQVVASDPNNWEGHMLLAEALRASGDNAGALERIEGAKPTTPQAELHFVKGRILEFNGKFAEAQPQYGMAVELDPDLLEARLLYGRSLAYQGSAQLAIENLDVAIAAFEKSEERTPGADLLLGDAYAARGVARRELGNLDEAEADLAKGVSLSPNNGDAWLKLGLTRFTATKYAKATQALQKAAEVIGTAEEGSTRHFDALFSLAQAAEKAKKTKIAKAAIGKYLGLANAEQHSRYGEAERLAKSLR